MREMILVHKADSDGGKVLLHKVKACGLRTEYIEGMEEYHITVKDLNELNEETKERFKNHIRNIDNSKIKGTMIFGEQGAPFGRTFIAVETPYDIMEKMYEDEKVYKNNY